MHDFIHHPDNRINIQGTGLSMAFWMILEPGYTLPVGYIGRLFTEGEVHQLIREGNTTQDQGDIDDVTLAGYVARLSEYQAADAAYVAGAYVENVGGLIEVSGPPSLIADKTEIANDSIETITLDCDLGDPVTDEVRWRVTAPDGTFVDNVENASGGTSQWILTTSHTGTHIVRIETDNYGWVEITFEGI